jgi:oligopeptide/dipeptide ABC transporter ATP-binding protein
MIAAAPNLRIEALSIGYSTRSGANIVALDDVSLDVEPGQCVAIVGESGSGKSTLGVAIGGLLPSNGIRLSGSVTIAGQSVYNCSRAALRALRREKLSFVFQNPVAALDPTMRVDRQLALVAGGRRARSVAISALERVGFRDPDRVARSYPHQLSGGMAQRVGIALALQRDPMIVVADEPTASLDATLRRRLLELLVQLGTQDQRSLLVLTHDLAAVARYATSVAVMYGGRIVEHGGTQEVFSRPLHPYTRALLESAPGQEGVGGRLASIAGSPPVLHAASPDCAFAARCPMAIPMCATQRPLSRPVGGRSVACHLAES